MRAISVEVQRSGQSLPGSPFVCCLYRTRAVAVQTEGTIATRMLDSLRVLSFRDVSAPIQKGDVCLLPACPQTQNQPERVTLLHINPYPTSLQCDFHSDALLSQFGLISRVTFGTLEGQITTTYAPNMEPTPCRVDAFGKPREVTVADVARVFMDAQIKFPLGTQIGVGDQIAVGPDTYDVVGHDAAGQADPLLLTVYVTKQVH